MNGYEATKAIRRSSHELAKTIPIIAMTANAFKYFFKYPLGIEINLKGIFLLSDKKKLTSISKATLLPDLDKDGTVSNTLKVGQEVVVQIVKEPISTKGPRLTSEISFAGRYLVLIPFNDKVSVSQKIK